jgi:transposase
MSKEGHVVNIQTDEMKCTNQTEMTVELSKDQITRLRSISRDKRLSDTIRMRAQVLLLLHQKDLKYATYHRIAEDLHIANATVRNTAKRFHELGFEQCMKYQRNSNSNASHKLSSEQEQSLRLLAISQPPEGHKRWTLRLLQERVMEENNIDHLSVETVRQILRRREQ